LPVQQALPQTRPVAQQVPATQVWLLAQHVPAQTRLFGQHDPTMQVWLLAQQTPLHDPVGHWQVPPLAVFEQVKPLLQVPQEPPQPSLPQFLPAQSGVQVGSQAPSEQREPRGQSPQLPPQPSAPHSLPEQSGMQSGGDGFRFFPLFFRRFFFAAVSESALWPSESPSATPNRFLIASRRSNAAVDKRLTRKSNFSSSIAHAPVQQP
jgi:hypothetical protein